MSKLALVTGGSRGIGAVVVALLRERGWDVLAPTRSECDWSNSSAVGVLYDSILRKLDAVVFCHGEWFWDSHPSTFNWHDQYAARVVLPSVFLRRIARQTEGGCVVMVASTRAFIGGRENRPYASACAAQVALMQGLAREDKRARYNAVCPGLTATRMGDEVIRTGGAKAGAVGQPPEAVADFIVRLVEDGESNGRVVRVVDSVAQDWAWGPK